MKLIAIISSILITLSAYGNELTTRDVRQAIQDGNLSFIKELTSDDEKLASIFKSSNLNPFQMAVYFNQPEILKELLSNYKQNTAEQLNRALIVACAPNKKSHEAIKLLISGGANINALVRGVNCLYTAVIAADYELFKYLLRIGANPDVEVMPDQGFGLGFPKKATINQLIKLRLKSYQEMSNT